MASSSAYYSNEEATIQRETEVDRSALKPVSSEYLDEIYEIKRCSDYIKEKKCKKVALQFPDSMLVDASNVAWQLEKNCNAKIYVLADTSYGHCDIDEVNAKHVAADLVIHYGESSLTPSATIPTLFVFGRHSTPIVTEELCNVFYKTFPSKTATRVVFLHHVTCNYIADEISTKLLPHYPYLSVGRLNVPKDPGGARGSKQTEDGSENILKDLCTKSCPGCPCRLEKNGDESKNDSPQGADSTKETQNTDSTKNNTENLTKPASNLSHHTDEMKDMDTESIDTLRPSKSQEQAMDTLSNSKISNGQDEQHDMEVDDSHQPDCKDYVTGFYTIPLEHDKELSDYNIFYLGPKNAESLKNLMLSHPSCDVHVYDPTTGYQKIQSNTNRQLMKRYYLVEKAKDAQIVGILVGTMGVAGYLECLNYMKKTAKFAGKKTYTFIMGKLTTEKLANFLEIDIYVLVANPEHSILDASNFYRPVVTPYEFDVACNPNREWSGNYITDFRSILPGGSNFVELPSDNSQTEETTVSLITGNIRTNVDIEDNIGAATSDAVALRNENTDVAVSNSSANRLSERSWKGLEQKLGETPVTKAKQGRSGIPVSYNQIMDF